MKEKFAFIFDMVKENMTKLDNKKIDVDQAKAMSALAKQANNVLVTQLGAAKFIQNNENAKDVLEQVGL